VAHLLGLIQICDPRQQSAGSSRQFNYLKSLLTGTALDAIAGLTLSDSNYEEAITILERRFGNRQQIIAKHMDHLLNVDPVTSASNLTGLRRLFDFVETHIRSLKSIGVAADSYGSLLSSVLLNKLPAEVRLLISRKVPEGEWSLDVLLKELQEELQARERVVVDKPSSNTTRNSGRSHPHTAAALVSSVSPGTTSCCYCQQAHPSRDCKVVTQAEARKQILRKSGRCFVCLRHGHLSRECRSKSRCSKCAKKHHTSICMGESSGAGRSLNRDQGAESSQSGPKVNSPVGQSQDAAASGSRLNVNAPSFPAQNTTSLYVTTSKTVVR